MIVVPRTESHPPTSQRILNLILLQRRSLLLTTNFEMLFALKLASLLKPLIAFGKMLREKSRSKSRVE
jgi:putative copper export protein